MNWSSAQQLARSGLHVRREAWTAGHWLIYQRGVAWYWNAAIWRVVTAGDFGLEEWEADDWTQIPAALVDCPPLPEPGDPGPGDTPGGPVDPDVPTDPDMPTDPDDPDLPPTDDPRGPGAPGTPTDPGRPKPPRRDTPSGCLTPSLSASAVIYCPDPDVPGEKRILITATLGGGNGDWSMKARIGTRLISLGVANAPDTVVHDDSINCVNDDPVLVVITATGFGKCSPQQLEQAVTTKCACPVCEAIWNGSGLLVAVSGGLTGDCVQCAASYDMKSTSTLSSPLVVLNAANSHTAPVGSLDWRQYPSTDGSCTEPENGSGSNAITASIYSCDQEADEIVIRLDQATINRSALFTFRLSTLSFLGCTLGGGDGCTPTANGCAYYAMTIALAP